MVRHSTNSLYLLIEARRMHFSYAATKKALSYYTASFRQILREHPHDTNRGQVLRFNSSQTAIQVIIVADKGSVLERGRRLARKEGEEELGQYPLPGTELRVLRIAARTTTPWIMIDATAVFAEDDAITTMNLLNAITDHFPIFKQVY